jgi:hypothetical protein
MRHRVASRDCRNPYRPEREDTSVSARSVLQFTGASIGREQQSTPGVPANDLRRHDAATLQDQANPVRIHGE